MDSIIKQSIANYLIDNNVFSHKQFGFIKVRSTVMQLLKGQNLWNQVVKLM